MSLITFISAWVISFRSPASLVSGPPHICTPKPKKMPAMMSWRMERRLHSSGKSGLVKKPTIMAPALMGSEAPGSKAGSPV